MWKNDLRDKEKAALEKLLLEAPYIQIATICEGEPYLIAMHYAYRDGAIYVHGANRGRKALAFAESKPVAFQIVAGVEPVPNDNPCDWSCRFFSILGRGRLERLTAEELPIALNYIAQKFSGKGDFVFPEPMLQATCVWRIAVSELTGRVKRYEL